MGIFYFLSFSHLLTSPKPDSHTLEHHLITVLHEDIEKWRFANVPDRCDFTHCKASVSHNKVMNIFITQYFLQHLPNRTHHRKNIYYVTCKSMTRVYSDYFLILPLLLHLYRSFSRSTQNVIVAHCSVRIAVWCCLFRVFSATFLAVFSWCLLLSSINW